MRFSTYLFAIEILCCLHFSVDCANKDEKDDRTKGTLDYHLVKLSRARQNYEKAIDAKSKEGKKRFQDKINKNLQSIHDIRDEKKMPGQKDLAYLDEKDNAKRERFKTSSARKRKHPGSPTASL